MSLLDEDKDGKLNKTDFLGNCYYWLKQILNPVSALVIVDVQNDFLEGSLALRNCPAGQDGLGVIPAINSVLDTVTFDLVVYTRDWHPQDHISFVDNVKQRPLHSSCKVKQSDAKLYDTVVFAGPPITEQKLWPRHCVQGSWGAEIHTELKIPDNHVIVDKGKRSEVDSYSAFWDNNKLSQTELVSVLSNHKVTDVHLCGVAYDVCVGFTGLHSIEHGFRTILIEDACRGVCLEDIDQMRKNLLEKGSVNCKYMQEYLYDGDTTSQGVADDLKITAWFASVVLGNVKARGYKTHNLFQNTSYGIDIRVREGPDCCSAVNVRGALGAIYQSVACMMVDVLPTEVADLSSLRSFPHSDSESDDGYLPPFPYSDDEEDITTVDKLPYGPSVIVIPEPSIQSNLISEKLHALEDDYCDIEDSEFYQCSKHHQELRQDVMVNERLLSESSDSSGSDSEFSHVVRRRKFKKRIRWKSYYSEFHQTLQEASSHLGLYLSFYVPEAKFSIKRNQLGTPDGSQPSPCVLFGQSMFDYSPKLKQEFNLL
ncbi:hypothetical protein FSP39_025191 [Pinctada imbricata]|uniref:nicotinamidase n=1 Tax=Pinctada imbricata TaxID=66713 RepID=A0AA88Y9B9_PINIB|nr:hypothetical protein FSP39_025191 [Pinctada imbricata]